MYACVFAGRHSGVERLSVLASLSYHELQTSGCTSHKTPSVKSGYKSIA